MQRLWWAVAAAAAVVAVVPWLDFLISVANRPIRIRTIISHRGNGFGFPENTVEAVSAAHENGFVVEVDIRLSKDNVPHLMHDSTLDRTTSCTGKIADMTSDELGACGVDTLADALATDAILELELKTLADPMANRIVDAVADIPPDRVIMFVSTATQASKFAAAFSRFKIMWRVDNVKSAKNVWPSFNRTKDMYAVDLHSLWAHPTLVRWVTSRTAQLDVYNAPHRWMLMGMPVTHVEADNPLTFESTNPSPAMPELVYRASAVGLIVALAVGWALRGWVGPASAYKQLKMIN